MNTVDLWHFFLISVWGLWDPYETVLRVKRNMIIEVLLTHTHTHTRAHTHTHTHTYIQTHTHTHTHTYIYLEREGGREKLVVQFLSFAQSDGAVKYTDGTLTSPGYDAKQSDGKASIILELRGLRSNPSTAIAQRYPPTRRGSTW